MGSLTRKLRKHTTGLSREQAQRIARNLSRHLEQQPTSNAVQAAMQAELSKMNERERVNLIAGQLSATEIRRRLKMSHAEQIEMYGYALRGGVSLLPEQPAAQVDDLQGVENPLTFTGEP